MTGLFDPYTLSDQARGIAQIKSGQYARLDTQLTALLVESAAPSSDSARAANGVSEGLRSFLGSVNHYANAMSTDASGRRFVVIDTIAQDGDGAALLAQLNLLGLQYGSSYGKVASGLLPVDALGSLAALGNLLSARESGMAVNAGLVTTQADIALKADEARATYGVDGTGLKIGVLSDSFDTSNSLGIDGKPDTLATNIASGDLPANTKIVQDYADPDFGTSDEGRGMAQLIHDIAPGASISFATAFTGEAGFANNILRLANDGARVIVDDVIYFFEPAYQDGIIAQAVDRVTAQGVTYFSSAGNNGNEGYESTWHPGSIVDGLGQLLQFAPGEELLAFTASAFEDIFIMQWDQPAASAGGSGSANDLDIYVLDAAGNIVGGSATNNLGSDPSEGFSFAGIEGETYYLAVALFSGEAPGLVKITALGNGSGVDLGTTEYNINSGTIYGHAAARGAIATAAAPFNLTPEYGVDPAVLEDFSSTGAVRIAFDKAGNRLSEVEVRAKPEITSVDGGNTTFFVRDSIRDADAFPNFFGTSASAPDAAAVAILILAANPSLTNTDILSLLKTSALDIDNPYTAGFDVGFDTASGYGLIQADKAVGYAKTLMIDNATAIDLFGTHLADTIVAGNGDNMIQGFAGNDTITTGSGADLIIFDTQRSTGFDRITDFSGRDVIVTNKILRDSNGDGIITFAANRVLNLETNGGDKVKLDGIDPAKGVRYLGERDGAFYYADSSVRPVGIAGQTVIEGTVGDDRITLAGTGKHVVFVDTANAALIGNDNYSNFGSKDILVTTSALQDSDGDRIIGFGSDKILQIDDGSLAFKVGSKAVKALEFDGSTTNDGVTYFVYSLQGSTAGLADLHF